MITRTQITFSAYGDRFTPSRVNAPFSSASDPGDIIKLGRNRGLPAEAGDASFDVPEHVEDKVTYIYQLVMPLMPLLRAAGAEEFSLMISYDYDSQCSIGFSKQEMRMLAELDCDVPINCFRDVEDKVKEAEPAAGALRHRNGEAQR